jgi:hypothetical protein
MKFNKILLIAAMIGSPALVTTNALALSKQVTISATVKTQANNTTNRSTDASLTTTLTWNTAKVYNLIATAVANVGTNGTGIVSTNLPLNGYIAFNPNETDGQVYGTFYVTNKTGFFYPLSGTDTNGNYYSFIELDTYLDTTDNSSTTNVVPVTNLGTNSGTNTINPSTNNLEAGAGLIDFGFSDNFNGIETGRFNSANGTGTETAISTALFYVHDNPYAFNAGNNPDGIYDNNNAFEIQGLADISITFKTNDVSRWTITVTGTGNAIVNGSQNAIVTTGRVTVSD